MITVDWTCRLRFTFRYIQFLNRCYNFCVVFSLFRRRTSLHSRGAAWIWHDCGPKDIVGVDPVRQVFFLSLSFGHYSDLHCGPVCTGIPFLFLILLLLLLLYLLQLLQLLLLPGLLLLVLVLSLLPLLLLLPLPLPLGVGVGFRFRFGFRFGFVVVVVDRN